MERKRIVVKVGTSTLTHQNSGLNFRNIDRIARVLTDLKNSGHEMILVTSGAIGAGVVKLHMKQRPKDVQMKQACAAVGQCELMHLYDKFFGEYGAAVGQILLTRDDVDHPSVKESLAGTFEALLGAGVIPVVNENDSVCYEEIESEHKVFGDNDTLSAVVAALVRADLLVLLSDIDGLYDADPHRSCDARLIPVIDELSDEIMALGGGDGHRRHAHQAGGGQSRHCGRDRYGHYKRRVSGEPLHAGGRRTGGHAVPGRRCCGSVNDD